MTQAHEKLERELEEWLGLETGTVAVCSSGTAALHLALECLELPQGSEVVVPDYSMIACPRAVSMAGHRPVFVDCGKDLNIDPALSAKAVVDFSPSAIMAVHVYGRRCDMEALSSPYGADEPACPWLIEDMAELHGVPPHPRSDAACWSFYKNKVVAGEEGGAVWFKDKERAEKARCLRSLGFTPAHDYWHVPRGHNYRMSDVHAELIRESLSQFVVNAVLRREREQELDLVCPPEWRMPARQAPWVYDLRISGLTAGRVEHLVAELNQQGIAARCGFKPMRKQEEYCLDGIDWGQWESDRAGREVLYLPLIGGVRSQWMSALEQLVGIV